MPQEGTPAAVEGANASVFTNLQFVGPKDNNGHPELKLAAVDIAQ